MGLSVSPDFKNPRMSLGKPQIWQKIENLAKIIKKLQMHFLKQQKFPRQIFSFNPKVYCL